MTLFGTLRFPIKVFAALLLTATLLLIPEIFGATNPSQADTPLGGVTKNSSLDADIAYRKRELEGDPNNAQARAQLALAYERKRDYQEMVDVLAPHKDKVGRSGLLLLARAYQKLKRPNEEIGTLELVNARYPKDASLITELAAAQARSSKREVAIATYYQAIETKKNYIPAYEGLLNELEKSESRQEARDVLSDMMKKFGKKGKWLSRMCTLYAADAFLEKSVETCKEAIKKDPENPSNPVHLATTYREQEKPEEAKKILVKAALKIRKSEPVQSALGAYFTEKKNYVDAYRWYKAGVKTDPKSYDAQLGLAMSALELQKMDESLKAFVAACAIDRKATKEFQNAMGRIRQRGDFRWQGRFEDAFSTSCGLSF